MSAIFACVMGLAIHASAMGQATISQYLWNASPFAIDETDRLDREVHLSEDERKIVKELFEAGSEDLLAIRRRFIRKTNAETLAAGIDAADQDRYGRFWFQRSLVMQEEALQREKAVLSDVRAVLSSDKQGEDWERYMSRRVTRVLVSDWYLPYSPENCLKGIQLSDEERKALGPVIEKYDDGLLALAKQLMKWRDEWIARSKRAGTTLLGGTDPVHNKLLVHSIRTLDAIESVLTPAHLDAFQRRRVGVANGCLGFVIQISRLESDENIKRVLRLSSLKKEQREILRVAATRANDRLYQLRRDDVRWIEQQALTQDAEPVAEPASQENDFADMHESPQQQEYQRAFSERTTQSMKVYTEIQSEYEKTVNETLTEAQWDELDRSAPPEMEVWLEQRQKGDDEWKTSTPMLETGANR